MTTRVQYQPPSSKYPGISDTNLHCPICGSKLQSFESMLKHLVRKHDISKRQARFFISKLLEWRQKRVELTSSLRQLAAQKGIDLKLEPN
jgi:hypothetical protein